MRNQVFIGKNVDTPEYKNFFHATAMSVYQRQPTMDDREYLTEAHHLDSYLPSTIIIVINCQDHSAFLIRTIDNKSFG